MLVSDSWLFIYIYMLTVADFCLCIEYQVNKIYEKKIYNKFYLNDKFFFYDISFFYTFLYSHLYKFFTFIYFYFM